MRGMGLGAGLGALAGMGAALWVTAMLAFGAFNDGIVGMLGVFAIVAPITSIIGGVVGLVLGIPVGMVLAAVRGERFAPVVSAVTSFLLPLAVVFEVTSEVILVGVGFAVIGWVVGAIFATTLDPAPPAWASEFHAEETSPVQH